MQLTQINSKYVSKLSEFCDYENAILKTKNNFTVDIYTLFWVLVNGI